MRQAIASLNSLKIALIDSNNNKIYTRLNDDCVSVIQHLGFCGMDYFDNEEFEDETGVYIDLVPAAMQFFGAWDGEKFTLIIDLIERMK